MERKSYTPLISFFVILLSTTSLISPALSDPQTQNLINQICRTTSDFAFCIDILGRHLISPKTDLAGLTRLTTSLSVSFAKDTAAFIRKANAAERNVKIKQVYDLCASNYGKVVGAMEGANYDANRGDFKNMVNLLQLGSKPIILCQAAAVNVVPILVQKNNDMRVLLSMGLYEGSIL